MTGSNDRGGFIGTDCEGTTVLNDNALELCQHFLKPIGTEFFTVVSRYDDYLGYYEKRPGYSVGDTLRFILPFLKAFGATTAAVGDLSRSRLRFMDGAKDGIQYWTRHGSTVVEISTGYDQFAIPVTRSIGIPLTRLYCTYLNLEQCDMSSAERGRLRDMAAQIAAVQDFALPEFPQRPLVAESERVIRRLDEIFWEILPAYESYCLIDNTFVVNAREKANAMTISSSRHGAALDRAVYVGDSSTDAEVLSLVRDAGGTTIVVNPDRFAFQHAELACAGPSSLPASVLAFVAAMRGREEALEVANNWTAQALRGFVGSRWFDRNADQLFEGYVGSTTGDTAPNLARQSHHYREKLRGPAVARLG
jgi:energy-converting hydrogenase A subunit R